MGWDAGRAGLWMFARAYGAICMVGAGARAVNELVATKRASMVGVYSAHGRGGWWQEFERNGGVWVAWEAGGRSAVFESLGLTF